MQYKQILGALLMGACLTAEVSAEASPLRFNKGKGFGGNKGANSKGGNGAGAAAASGSTGGASTVSSAATASTATAAAAAAAGGSNDAASLTLNPANVATGSEADGSQASGATAQQALSATSNDNFINFCSGKTLTNGLQVKGGSCNGIVMGDIPASTAMVSTIITNPQAGANIAANTDFNLTANMQNINTGSFTNPDATYYSAPQALSGGKIVGHTHFTVQDMGAAGLNPTTALDATTFAFFKGVDAASDGAGNLAIPVVGGLPAGNYRVCTMSASSNHQPVLMPLAQRGAQDDCTKFTVGGAGGAAAAGGSSTASAAAGNASSATSAAAGTATSAAAANGGNGGSKSGSGKQNKGQALGQQQKTQPCNKKRSVHQRRWGSRRAAKKTVG